MVIQWFSVVPITPTNSITPIQRNNEITIQTNKQRNNQTNNLMAKVIEGLYYSESHEYVKVDGEYGYVGITDYAQEQLGNVVYVDMPEVDDEATAGEEFGAVESVKAASDLISPISGIIVEINEELEEQPELINKDAFENWIMKVKMSDPGELDALMSAAEYESSCK